MKRVHTLDFHRRGDHELALTRGGAANVCHTSFGSSIVYFGFFVPVVEQRLHRLSEVLDRGVLRRSHRDRSAREGRCHLHSDTLLDALLPDAIAQRPIEALGLQASSREQSRCRMIFSEGRSPMPSSSFFRHPYFRPDAVVDAVRAAAPGNNLIGSRRPCMRNQRWDMKCYRQEPEKCARRCAQRATMPTMTAWVGFEERKEQS